jgi:hypothetical protein
MHITTPCPPENNRLELKRYTWCAKLFIALVLVGGIATTYTLVNLILEGL